LVLAQHAEAVQTRGSRTRQRLLAEAIAQFARSGYRHTSVSEIARQVGLTPAAAYAYFLSKEALFAAAVDADAAGLVELAAQVLGTPEPGDDLARVLDRMMEGLLAAVERHPLVLRVLGGAEPLPEIPSLAGLEAGVAGLLEIGQSVGLVRTDIDPATVATGLVGIVLGQLIAILHGQMGPGDRRWRGVIAVMDAALRPPLPTGRLTPARGPS